MKEINNNIIKISILGTLMLFLFLTPISYIQTSPDAAEGREHNTVFLDNYSISKVFAQTPVTKDTQTSNDNKAKGDDSWMSTQAQKIANAIFGTLGGILLSMGSFILFIGGMLLEFSLKHLVLGMGSLINGSVGVTIDSLWKIIRDISNLAFIFGFIYIGIRTIIDPENASTKRFLAKIIIGALLINFSLFFVKAIIDFSNFTAVQIYNEMITGTGTLSGKVTQILGLASFYKVSPETLAMFSGIGSGLWFYAFASLFLVVTGFVFAAGAIMLITRFVVLVFVMIFSPLLFAATIFPQTEQHASDLWKKLISNAFFAPVYLLLLFIVLKFVENFHIQGGNASFTDALARPGGGAVDSFAVILQFFIIIGMMIGALTIASKIGVAGGDMITAKTKSLIGASTVGLAARAGRATFGQKASEWSEDEKLKDKASKGGVSGWSARQRLKLYRSGADASFDGRNTATGKSLGIGSGRKGGYATVKKEAEAAEEKFAKSLGEVGDDDFRVEARKKEMGLMEKHVRELEEDLKAEKNLDEKKKIREKIEEAKHHVHEAKVKYESEKQRRILGSTFEAASIPNDVKGVITQKEKGIDEMKKLLDTQWKLYNETDNLETKKNIEQIITGYKKGIKDHQEEIHQLKLKNSDMGYAGVRENSNIFTAWPIGRLVAHEKSAGKAMRKARKDGLPKEKGGHDDHGGGGHGDAHEEEHEPVHAPAPKPKAAPATHAPAGGGHDDHGHAPAHH